MVGSIDPRCETVRGTHWPKPGRVVVWSSRRGNHLGQRFKPTASKGRTYGCKRSDQAVKKLLCHGGPSTYGSRLALRLAGTTARSIPRRDAGREDRFEMLGTVAIGVREIFVRHPAQLPAQFAGHADGVE